jgi:hypothetical protein
MPTRTPHVSPELLKDIDRAEAMHNFVLATAPETFKLDNDTKTLVVSLFALVVEHHGAILYLLKSGRFDGSALALVRPLIDACYRAHWIFCCAKPKTVARIYDGKGQFPGLIDMAKEVEKKTKAAGFFTTVVSSLNSLHGYTHGGLEQLGRRFDAAGNVNPTYADGEKQEAALAITAHFVMLAVTWCQIVGTSGTDSESPAARIMDRYSELFAVTTS